MVFLRALVQLDIKIDAKRFVKAAIAGLLTFAVIFVLFFGGELLYASQVAPHDGQAGMGGAFFGFIVGLPIAGIVYAVVLFWPRDKT